MRTIKTPKKYLGLTLALFALLFQIQLFGSEGLSKKVSKNFKVTKNHTLEIENQFGSVDITSWDKDEVMVDIEIIVDHKKDDKEQEWLDKIEVEIKESSDRLSFKTEMGVGDKKFKMDGKYEIEINYTVKMPAHIELDLDNRFGDITLDKLDKRAEIKVQFGSAKIGSLSHNANDLSFQFSDPVIIDEFGGGEIELKFSKLELGNSGQVNFSSQMSNSTIDKAENSEMKVSYGSLKVGNMSELKLKSSMSTIKIDELQNGGEIDVKYGKLTIGKLSKNFKSLTIESKFTPVDIDVEDGSAFELDANTKMSDLDLPSGYVVKDASEYMKIGRAHV